MTWDRMSCSHLQYCDTTANINEEVYEQMSQAAASVMNVSSTLYNNMLNSVTERLLYEFVQTLMMKEDLKAFLNSTEYTEYMYDYVFEDSDL